MYITKRVTKIDLVSERIPKDRNYDGYLIVATQVLHEARRHLFEMEWQLDDAAAKFRAAGSLNEVIELINSILAQLPNERADRFGMTTGEHKIPYDDEKKRLLLLNAKA
jgi:hypothetical protein